MIKHLFRIALAALFVLGGVEVSAAQQSGALIGGGGTAVFKVIPLPSGQFMIGQGAASDPLAYTLSGDCTLTGGGVITCLKTSGSSFGTAAVANTGASGSAVPILNAPSTVSALWTFTSHMAVSATPPVITGCGGGSPAVVGDDKDGQVTMGTSATACIITFAVAYTSAPLCTVTWQATPLASQSYSVSTTAITTAQTSTSSNKLNYHCMAQNGG